MIMTDNPYDGHIWMMIISWRGAARITRSVVDLPSVVWWWYLVCLTHKTHE